MIDPPQGRCGTKNEVQTLIGYPFNRHRRHCHRHRRRQGLSDGHRGRRAAWLASTGDEAGFVTALKAGTKLVVNGTSQRGTKTTDTYSLSRRHRRDERHRHGLPVTVNGLPRCIAVERRHCCHRATRGP